VTLGVVENPCARSYRKSNLIPPKLAIVFALCDPTHTRDPPAGVISLSRDSWRRAVERRYSECDREIAETHPNHQFQQQG
jgi:hypothetical protein